MQLAGGLFLDRSDRSFRRKIQETLLAMQIERNYTKQQIFTMYANQVYLAHGNYGFEAASEFYFGRPVGKLTLARSSAARRAYSRSRLIRRSLHPQRALERRNLVLDLMQRDGKITTQQERQAQAAAARSQRAVAAKRTGALFRRGNPQISGTHLWHRSGARARPARLHHAQRRPCSTPPISAVRDGLHAYDRRHGWRGNLPNIIRDQHGVAAELR